MSSCLIMGVTVLNWFEVSNSNYLHGTHVSRQGRLVTHGGGDTSEQGRHLGTSLRESKDWMREECEV